MELLADCKDLLLRFFNKNILNAAEYGHKNNYDNLAPDEGEAYYTWPRLGYAVVAISIREGLQALGYSQIEQKGAIKLWYDYCSKERPDIRKTAVWSATVIYAYAWLEKKAGLKQQELACRYSIAPSTISSRFMDLRKSLNLVTGDQRYVTKPDKK